MAFELSTTSPNFFPKGSDAKSALVIVSLPEPGIYLVEFRNPPDNRLLPKFVNDSVLPALDAIELAWRKSENKEAALITVGDLQQNRFYSNGLDPKSAFPDPNFFPNTFNPFLSRFLTFPIPCIAAINGHAFAGGFITALAHDYRVMKYLPSNGKGQAFACMNELEIGLSLPHGMRTLVKEKLPGPKNFQKAALEAYRFNAEELSQIGVVDKVVEYSLEDKQFGEKIISAALQLAREKKVLAKSGVFGQIKIGMWKDILDSFANDIRYPLAFEDQEKRLKELSASAKL